MAQTVLYQQQEDVAVITLNRPEALNAINRQLLSELAEAIVQFDQEPSARVAIIAGAIFLLAHEFIRLGSAYELAPGITDALSQTGWLAAYVGAVLIFFIGVLLFSFAILRTSVVPKWTGWLGVIAALGFCLMALLPLVFSMATPWFLARIFLVWMVAMGVVLLRLKEPVAPDSVA